MASIIRAAESPITIAATGPLTNVALFLGAYPALRARVQQICVMGGAIGEGNITASAEFNIWVDPDAAARVFDSGVPLTMIGLDVTHQAVVPVAVTDRLADLGTQTGRIFADLFRYFAIFHRERYDWDGSPIHDAVAIAHLLGLGIVQTSRYRVDVEVASELTRGRTVVDREGISGLPPNADVGIGIDRDRFIQLILDAVAQFP
jgi:pyrimidine-specific ribonucleoside hydrolase